MTAIKILMAHNRYLISGGERSVFEAELGLLRDHGHEVGVYMEDNVRIAELGALNTAARTVWSRETYRQVRRKLRLDQFDIVHVHNFFPLISPSIFYAAQAEHVPVVQTLHNFRLLCLNGLLFRDGTVCEDCIGRSTVWPGVFHACYRDSRKGSAIVASMLSFHRAIKTWDRMVHTYVALTEFSRQKLVEGGLPASKIRVKPNFMPRDPGQGNGPKRFALFVGRLSPEKGIDTMLAAWRLLGNQIPLRIVGDGPLREKVITYAKSLSAVEYLGRLANDEVLHLMQQALFLIFPSICYENFPMIIVEAFAAGLPVLASDLGNSGALIQSHSAGRHFEPGNASDLADKALWLASNPGTLQKMAKAARMTYEDRYTPASNYRMLTEIYELALATVGHGA